MPNPSTAPAMPAPAHGTLDRAAPAAPGLFAAHRALARLCRAAAALDAARTYAATAPADAAPAALALRDLAQSELTAARAAALRD